MGLRGRVLLLTAVAGAAVVAAVASPMEAVLAAGPLVLLLIVALLFVAPQLALILLLVSFYNPAVTFVRLNLALWSYAATGGLCFAATVVLMVRRKARMPAVWRPAAVALGVIGLVTLVAAAHGAWRGNDLLYVGSDLVQILELLGVLWLTFALFWHFRGLRLVLATILPIFVITVAWEQLFYFAEGSAFLRLLPPSAALKPAVAGDSLVLAGYSPTPAAFLPTLLAVILFARKHLPRWCRVLCWAALALSVMSVALSLKRSIWASEALAIALLIVLALRVRPLPGVARATLAALAVGGLLAGGLALLPRGDTTVLGLVKARLAYTGTQLQDRGNPGVESRRSEYSIVRHELVRSPILGAGLGATYRGHTPDGEFTKKHFMHNTYLAVGYRMGLFGMCGLLGGLFALALLPARRIRPQMDSLDQALALGAVASFSMLALQALTTGTLLSHPISAYAGFFLGMAHYLVVRGSRPILPADGAAESRAAPPSAPAIAEPLPLTAAPFGGGE